MIRNRLMHPISTLMLGLMLGGLSSPAEVPPPQELLPEDTVAVVTVPEYAKSCAAWSTWPSWRVWQDPAMKPLTDKFKERLRNNLIEPLEKELGVHLADYAKLLQGQVTFALILPATENPASPEVGFVLLVDTRDQAEALSKNLENLRQKWTDSGKKLRRETVRGVEFTVLTFHASDIDKVLEKAFPEPKKEKASEGEKAQGNESGSGSPDKPEGDGAKKDREIEWYVGQSDSLLLLGSRPADLEKVLARKSGASVPPLADKAEFNTCAQRMFRKAMAYSWVDLGRVMDMALAAAKAEDEKRAARESGDEEGLASGISGAKIIEALGLTSLRTLAWTLHDEGDAGVFDLWVKVPASARRGLTAMLAFESKEAGPPSFVPGDVLRFNRWRLDLKQAWETLEKTLNEISPQLGNVVKFMIDYAGKDKDPNFDLRTSLLDNLGDDFISYEKAPRGATLQEFGNAPSLTLIKARRSDQAAAAVTAFRSLLPQQAGMLKERDFLGRKLYSMHLTLPTGEDKPTALTLRFTASSGYLAFSYDAAIIEEFLRGNPSQTLRQVSGFSEIAQRLGGTDGGLFGFENETEGMRALMEMLRQESGSLSQLFTGASWASRFGMGGGVGKLDDWFDFSLLPPFEKIEKYFYRSGWAGRMDDEGFSLKAITLFSPQYQR